MISKTCSLPGGGFEAGRAEPLFFNAQFQHVVFEMVDAIDYLSPNEQIDGFEFLRSAQLEGRAFLSADVLANRGYLVTGKNQIPFLQFLPAINYGFRDLPGSLKQFQITALLLGRDITQGSQGGNVDDALAQVPMLAFQEGARIRPTIFIWGTTTTRGEE